MNKNEEAINKINVMKVHKNHHAAFYKMQRLLNQLIEQDPNNDTFNALVTCNNELEECSTNYAWLANYQSNLIRDLKNEITNLKCKIADMA